jgi:pimeloyl-ACP methyl ester carboxylesterase
LLNNRTLAYLECALRRTSNDLFTVLMGIAHCWRRSRLFVYAALLLVAGCQEESGPQIAGSLGLKACRIHGIDTEVLCGELSVPEQRIPVPAHPGRTISIHFALIPALARGKHLDPIFVLAGGPGQAATSVGGLVLPLFSRLNRERDIVLVDQRGTGGSNPLQCNNADDPDNAALDLDPKAQTLRLAGCAAELKAKGNDLTQYTTPIAVRDLDEIRAHLRYPTINLWGASYGTRVALEYLREFGAHVRTATLDGVAPASMKLPISGALDADQALDRLIADCHADDPCNQRVPNLASRVDGLFARLSTGAAKAEVILPRTGQRQSVEISRAVVSGWVRAPLYSPLTASLIPDLVVRAGQGDFSPLLAASLAVTGDVTDDLSFGMHLSVICSEDMSIITPADISSLAATRFGESFFEQYRALCAQWPVGALPATYFEPVKSDVPVLLLSGGIDPATPPRHAEKVALTLSHARHLIAPNLGHGISLQGCGPDLVDQFIRGADPGALDGACLKSIPRPPFFAPVSGGHS